MDLGDTTPLPAPVGSARPITLAGLLVVTVVIASALVVNMVVLAVFGADAWGFTTRGSASASCATTPSVEQALKDADLVFVGMVTSTRSQGRVAFVRVEDRWKGTGEPRVDVYGGPAADNAATSVDRRYQSGQRYLFFVQEPARHGRHGAFAGRYQDNGCSATRPYTVDLAAFRPSTAVVIASPEVTQPQSSTASWRWPAAIGATAIVALAAAMVISRRRAAVGPPSGRRG